MNIHDNPNAFTGIRILGNNIKIIGGRVTRNGSLGIGGGIYSPLLIDGVEIDHNGGSANCGFEGGGIKLVVSHSLLDNNYVHDNNCMGIWYDINSADNEIAHNRVDNNGEGGIFYEISQSAWIHDNEVSGNGSAKCSWLWGAGIGIASSFNVRVYGNALSGNCNGITGTQQDRPDSTPPDHLLANLSVHDNRVAGPGKVGVGADNRADLTTRDIAFVSNAYTAGAQLCKFSC
ncbi:MAG: right-handed parallel beta-helix repeat-containing protein, partial [Solirubrobacteraceae bacterium]